MYCRGLGRRRYAETVRSPEAGPVSGELCRVGKIRQRRGRLLPGRLAFQQAGRDVLGLAPIAATPLASVRQEIALPVIERPDESYREIYGSRRYAVSKPGTLFHVRMGAWPKAIVEAMLDVCRRHFPPSEWSIYVHGHSTGGPFVHTAMQRVEVQLRCTCRRQKGA